jgi:hypothetical protein
MTTALTHLIKSLRWNTDMDAAPRDGTPFYVDDGDELTKVWWKYKEKCSNGDYDYDEGYAFRDSYNNIVPFKCWKLIVSTDTDADVMQVLVDALNTAIKGYEALTNPNYSGGQDTSGVLQYLYDTLTKAERIAGDKL